MAQYTYKLSIHSTIDVNFFYVMYDYNFEIKLKIENDFFRKKMSIVKKKIYKNSNKRYRNVELTLSNYKQTLQQKA